MALTATAAADALRSDNLLELGLEADALRRQLHPGDTATYTVVAQASLIPAPDGSLLAAAQAAEDAGTADLVLHGAASLAGVEAVLQQCTERFPRVRLHGLSAPEVLLLSFESGRSLAETLQRLQHAGLRSLGGGGAAILNDALRSRHPHGSCTAREWLAVHRAAHALGLPSFAGMAMGIGEEQTDRIEHLEHLERLRDLQEETHGFIAFQLRVNHVTVVEARREEEATGVDYLKTLATARLVLETIPHVEADWTVQGPKMLGLALRFGADDAGSVSPRRNTGREPSHHSGEAELRRIIRDAGLRPVARDLLYRHSILH